jgi:hypothetical protein
VEGRLETVHSKAFFFRNFFYFFFNFFVVALDLQLGRRAMEVELRRATQQGSSLQRVVIRETGVVAL